MIAGFPAGTVSGAPKIRAMQIIDELEPDRRGVYSGAIGYISAAGDLDTCIALRTAQVCDGQLHIQAARALSMTVTRRPNSRKHRTRPWPDAGGGGRVALFPLDGLTAQLCCRALQHPDTAKGATPCA